MDTYLNTPSLEASGGRLAPYPPGLRPLTRGKIGLVVTRGMGYQYLSHSLAAQNSRMGYTLTVTLNIDNRAKRELTPAPPLGSNKRIAARAHPKEVGVGSQPSEKPRIPDQQDKGSNRTSKAD